MKPVRNLCMKLLSDLFKVRNPKFTFSFLGLSEERDSTGSPLVSLQSCNYPNRYIGYVGTPESDCSSYGELYARAITEIADLKTASFYFIDVKRNTTTTPSNQLMKLSFGILFGKKKQLYNN